MKIIIVGAGKVGSNLIKLLSDENHDVTIIDIDRKLVETVVNDYDVIGYHGNGASFPVQEDAGVESCDVFIAVTGSDELNVMSCLVASKIGAEKTVARVRNTDYSEQLLFMQNKLGIDLLINSEFETAAEISRIIEFPAATAIETFAKGRIDLAEIVVSSGGVLDGIMLRDIRKALDVALLICAVQRGDEVIIPSGNFVLQSGDRVHFTAAKKELQKIFKAIGMQKKKIKSTIIVGGSRTSYYLSRLLKKSGINVKLIESDRARATELEGLLDGVSVICADGTDTDVLKEEGLENFDSTVALTDIDEENIIFSMYARSQGVKKTVCKVNRGQLSEMVSTMMDDCSFISPKANTAAIILRYIRAVENAGGSEIETLYKILDGRAEAIEFISAENCPLNDIPIKELSLKPNIIIACVSHAKEIIIPDGNTVIRAGDSVIVITAGRTVYDLSEILK